MIIVIIIAHIDKILNRGGTLRTPRGH